MISKSIRKRVLTLALKIGLTSAKIPKSLQSPLIEEFFTIIDFFDKDLDIFEDHDTVKKILNIKK